jgi:DNA-directed RNA polymerase specialized sigma24 family protein
VTAPGMMYTMRETPDLDRLVARAQQGDSVALEALCARARPMLCATLVASSRAADIEDAVQDALMLACARIGTYRYEGSFAGWLYAIATRSMLRRAASAPQEAALAVELSERALLSDHDPMTEAEWRLVEQEFHLACTVGVLNALSPEARRLYLLGDVLAVPDRVGAQVAQVTPATYRKRLQRARRGSPTPPARPPGRPPTTAWPSPPKSSTPSSASASCTALTLAAAAPTAQSARSSGSLQPSPPDLAGQRCRGTTKRRVMACGPTTLAV